MYTRILSRHLPRYIQVNITWEKSSLADKLYQAAGSQQRRLCGEHLVRFRWLAQCKSVRCMVRTSVDEFEDTSEAGVVGLNVVCVEFENKVPRGRVESSLRKWRQRVITTQLVVPLVLLVHCRLIQVQEKSHEVRAPAVTCAILIRDGHGLGPFNMGWVQMGWLDQIF